VFWLTLILASRPGKGLGATADGERIDASLWSVIIHRDP
jgi:hypothetical protein